MTLQMFKREAYDFGFTAGEERGFTLGAKEAKLETAKIMKSENMPITTITHFTGLSVEEIEKL